LPSWWPFNDTVFEQSASRRLAWKRDKWGTVEYISRPGDRDDRRQSLPHHFRRSAYPRDLGPNPAGWVRDLPAEEFLNLMSGAGVDRAVLVQAFGAYRYDNRYVAKSAARYPDRFVAVCIIDPMQPDAPEKSRLS
jgi:predicted TIM-barrel fold metal-dependent hydrolase